MKEKIKMKGIKFRHFKIKKNLKDRAFFITKIIFTGHQNKILYKLKVIRNFGVVVIIDTGHHLTSHTTDSERERERERERDALI